VRASLENDVLNVSQLVSFLHWYCSNLSASSPKSGRNQGRIENIFKVVRWRLSDQKEVNHLSKICFFSHGDDFAILSEPSTLPASVSENFTKIQLAQMRLKPLPIAKWIAHLESIAKAEFVNHQQVLSSIPFWTSVLQRLSRHLGQLSKADWKKLNVLKSIKCVPSNAGLVCPEEAYFASDTLPPHLPRVSLVVQEAELDASKVHRQTDEFAPEFADKSDDADENPGVNSILLQNLGVRRVAPVKELKQNSLASATDSIKALVASLMAQEGQLGTHEWKELAKSKCVPAVSACAPRAQKGVFPPSDVHFPWVATDIGYPALLIINWPELHRDSAEHRLLKRVSLTPRTHKTRASFPS